MTEYWKSHARKYCDFCECWFTDNKISIEFHERGKKHKENVQKRLAEIGKKSQEDHEIKLKEDDFMKQMEEAALKAYKKDIDTNPDFTGSKVAEMAKSQNAKIVVGKEKNTKSKTDKSKSKVDKEKKQKPLSEEAKKWKEAKTPEGFSYYWNADTAVSVWDPPPEGYISWEAQQPSEPKTSQENEAKSDTPATVSTVQYGPAYNANPYGTWENNAPVITEDVCLQLPSLPEPEYYAPEVTYSKPEVKFKEKEVTLSGSNSQTGGSTSFKRKTNEEPRKKNVRPRIVD